MKIKNYILFIVLCLCSSCNDGFLDVMPRDKLSDESYWKDGDDATKYVNSIYRNLIIPDNYVIMTDTYTDNAIPIHVFAAQGQISSGTSTASTGHFKEVWQLAYQGIRRCNVFFENIEGIEMSVELKSQLTGEVEFLRAFFYTTLTRLYGGVPLVLTPLELNEAIPSRSTADEMFDFIIAELDKAALNLPVSYANPSDIGRATKGAALSLKATLCLYYSKFEQAANAAKAVMDLGVYDLFNDYEGLFLPENENNQEVIFDKQFMEDQYTSGIDVYFAPTMFGGWSAISPTQEFVDAYQCTDGKSIKDSPLYDPENPYLNRDPRQAKTILWHGAEFAGMTYNTLSGSDKIGSGNATRTGYCIRKYINPNNPGCIKGSWTNFIYLRYADILLIYAEATNEMKGPDASVYEAVNKIRQRESVNMPPLPENMNKEQMREAIHFERRIELAFEGVRLFDVRRLRIAEKVVTQPVYGQIMDGEHIYIETRKFNPEKDYLWGIPLTEIDLAKGVLEQNPGY